MLVVDDESDYASVNTNYRTTGDTSPTLINQKIRELLALTTRSSYMAFTATPFANVFIDHDTFDEALQGRPVPPPLHLRAVGSVELCRSQELLRHRRARRVTAGLVDITDAHETFRRSTSHISRSQFFPESLEEALRAFVVAVRHPTRSGRQAAAIDAGQRFAVQERSKPGLRPGGCTSTRASRRRSRSTRNLPLSAPTLIRSCWNLPNPSRPTSQMQRTDLARRAGQAVGSGDRYDR